MLSENLRVATRTALRQWRLVLTLVLSIGFAIGVNTTMHALLQALVHPEMDMPEPERLYWARFYGNRRHTVNTGTIDSLLVSHARSFTVARHQLGGENHTLVEGDTTFTATTRAFVGPEFFLVLGATAAAGRFLGPEDTTASTPRLVLSQELARALFGRDSAVGRTVAVNGVRHLVVGIAGERIDFPNAETGLWTLRREWREFYAYPHKRLIRLRPDRSRADAEGELAGVSGIIATMAAEAPAEDAFRLQPAMETQFRYERFHLALVAGTLVVLIVAAGNAANFELARSLMRRRDLAIRSALGASPSALRWQVFVEESILIGLSLILALAMAHFGAQALYHAVPPSVGEFVVVPHVTWRVVAFAVATAAVVLLTIGILPAIRAGRSQPLGSLQQTAGTGRTQWNRRQYAALVVVQIGGAIVLASAAVVMFRGRSAVESQPFGFDPRPLVTGGLPRAARSTTPIRSFLNAVAEEVRGTPGVRSAVAILNFPVRQNVVSVLDSGALREVPAPGVKFSMVSAGYIRTIGARVVAGSDFDTTVTVEPQVILDEQSGSRLWPGQSPVGQRLMLGRSGVSLRFARVVGVISGVPDSGRRRVLGPPPPARTLRGLLYFPASQEILGQDGIPAYFIARGDTAPEDLALGIRRHLITTENARGAFVEPMEEALGITRARASRTFLVQLFAFFALTALGMAAYGIAGVVAYATEERTTEIALRRALGATEWGILHALLREAVPIALMGIATGLLGVKFGIPLLRSMAIANDQFHALLFLGISISVTLVLGACALQVAKRARRVHPSDALRSV